MVDQNMHKLNKMPIEDRRAFLANLITRGVGKRGRVQADRPLNTAKYLGVKEPANKR